MLNKNEFKKIREEIEKIGNKREEVIEISRNIIHLSKRIIYATQRNDLGYAASEIEEIKKNVSKLKKIDFSADTNINSVAFQEYVEAICFYDYVKNGKLSTRASLGVNIDDYLSGICDLTGELVRKAVYEAIHKRFDEVSKIKELVGEIYGEFLQLNLRNGDLRKKSDSIKWNLIKLEDVMYDIKIKDKD